MLWYSRPKSRVRGRVYLSSRVHSVLYGNYRKSVPIHGCFARRCIVGICMLPCVQVIGVGNFFVNPRFHHTDVRWNLGLTREFPTCVCPIKTRGERRLMRNGGASSSKVRQWARRGTPETSWWCRYHTHTNVTPLLPVHQQINRLQPVTKNLHTKFHQRQQNVRVNDTTIMNCKVLLRKQTPHPENRYFFSLSDVWEAKFHRSIVVQFHVYVIFYAMSMLWNVKLLQSFWEYIYGHAWLRHDSGVQKLKLCLRLTARWMKATDMQCWDHCIPVCWRPELS